MWDVKSRRMDTGKAYAFRYAILQYISTLRVLTCCQTEHDEQQGSFSVARLHLKIYSV